MVMTMLKLQLGHTDHRLTASVTEIMIPATFDINGCIIVSQTPLHICTMFNSKHFWVANFMQVF